MLRITMPMLWIREQVQKGWDFTHTENVPITVKFKSYLGNVFFASLLKIYAAILTLTVQKEIGAETVAGINAFFNTEINYVKRGKIA